LIAATTQTKATSENRGGFFSSPASFSIQFPRRNESVTRSPAQALNACLMKHSAIAALLVFIASLLSLKAAEDLAAFPPAEKGMVRHVLRLPKKDDDKAFKIELIVGKTVKVDAANRYFFGGKIEEQNIQGWGYVCYRISELGPMAGTLMAADPAAPKEDRFVALGGEPYLVRYNSRLPLVVYVPEGVTVRYRVWSASAETMAIDAE
jgi:ecotin